MKKIFNRRFWLSFVVTFLLTLLFGALGTANHYFDSFLGNVVPHKNLFVLCLYIAIGLIPTALGISTALASFISFKNLPSGEGIKGFFRTLGTGLICFVPLAFAIYMFDAYM